MAICPRCNAENVEGAKFCESCGMNLEIALGTVVQKPKKPNFFAELFKKLGKKGLIIIGVVVLVIAIGAVCYSTFVAPYLPHYINANKAFEAGDYGLAIREYIQAGNFMDSEEKLDETYYANAEALYKNGEFIAAADQYALVKNNPDAEGKIKMCADVLLEKKEYVGAAEIYEMIGTEEVEGVRNYALGMALFEDDKYKDAKAKFECAEGYGDSETMINACELMRAEGLCEEGYYDAAKAVYKSLPEGFTYDGISASARIALIENLDPLLDMMGTWYVDSNYIESRNVYKRNGSWNNWYHDSVLSGQSLTLSCSFNSDNTVDISGKVTFYKFDDYSSLSQYCQAEKTTKSFNIYNVTSMPSSYDINSNTTLTYSNGTFTLKYSERDNYSAYFYNMYNSTVKFKK